MRDEERDDERGDERDGEPARAALGPWARSLVVELTPGQRWTAALALGFSVLLLLFGLPATTDFVEREAGAAPSRAVAPPAMAGASPPGTTASSLPSPDAALSPDAGAPGAPSAGPVPQAPALDAAKARPTEGPLRVAALVRPGGALPGRDEVAMAALFLGSEASLSVTTVALDGANPCEAAARAGDVAVAGDALPPAVRDCLVARGTTVLAHDVFGSRGRRASPPGQVVSTRRSLADSLLDTRGELRGRVAIVASSAQQELAGSGIRALQRAGVRVEYVGFLADPPAGTADIPSHVLVAAGRDVETVLFAVPVAQQAAWAAHHSLMAPEVRYVVADAADAIVNESYPPAFRAARAVTTLRVPWERRRGPERDDQATCRRRYEATVTPPQVLDNVELAHVLVWCQHATLLRSAVSAGRGGDVGQAIVSARHRSPLTSDLATPDGMAFGPTQVAVLVWDTGCRCWTLERGFRDREPAR